MSHKLLRILPIFLLAIICGTAHAAVIETQSSVTAVTIYTDRANVTRTAKVHLPAGDHIISLTDLPAGLHESTLRVEGKAGAAVKIGTVALKHIYLTDLANEAEREKAAQINAKTNEKTLLEGRIKALKAKESFIGKVVQAGAITRDKLGNATLDFEPEKWQQAWSLIQKGMEETEKELATESFAMNKIDAEIAKLQNEMDQLSSQQNKERLDVHVNVTASTETDINLELSYQTSGASWSPIYDARLETSSSQLQLEQYGSVSQHTGEDWKSVKLSLSTAQPAFGSEMPNMQEWWVRVLQPSRMMRNNVAGSSGSPLSFSESKMDGSLEIQNPILKEEYAEKTKAHASTTEYSAEFNVPGRVDLKSTEDSTKLFIGAINMKAKLSVQTTPRLGTLAYLFAKTKSNETYPLIPGEVAKYRDGYFIGNANLPLVRPDEEIKFSYGVDDRIKVEYKLLKRELENPTLVVVGDATESRQYQSKIQNLHKAPITITVLDQYPVSSDADVEISLLKQETTQGFFVPDEKRQGTIAWTDTVKPKEEKEYNLGFRVKYPKDRKVQGL